MSTDADQTVSNASQPAPSDAGTQAIETGATGNDATGDNGTSSNDAGASAQGATGNEINELAANEAVNAADGGVAGAGGGTDEAPDLTMIAIVAIAILVAATGVGLSIRHFRNRSGPGSPGEEPYSEPYDEPPGPAPFVPVTITPRLDRAFDGGSAPDWNYTGPRTCIRSRLEFGEVAWKD